MKCPSQGHTASGLQNRELPLEPKSKLSILHCPRLACSSFQAQVQQKKRDIRSGNKTRQIKRLPSLTHPLLMGSWGAWGEGGQGAGSANAHPLGRCTLTSGFTPSSPSRCRRALQPSHSYLPRKRKTLPSLSLWSNDRVEGHTT